MGNKHGIEEYLPDEKFDNIDDILNKNFCEFSLYLISQYAEENLLFYNKVNQYKNSKSHIKMIKLFNEIMNEFITPDSPRCINIPYQMRRQLIKHKHGPPHLTRIKTDQNIKKPLSKTKSFKARFFKKKSSLKHSASENNMMFTQTLDRHIFDKALNECKKLMQRNFCDNFIKSQRVKRSIRSRRFL